MGRLENKTAIITGAAHGIGSAIAELFAEQGAWVLATDIDGEAGEAVSQRITSSGGRCRFAVADVRSERDIAHAVETAVMNNGRIDVLVNNAALLTDFVNAQDATADHWDQSFAITLKGAGLFTRAVLPYMMTQKTGSIINVASVQGLVGARTSAVYTSMKHGLAGLTRSIACDFGPHGIRCNAICPGPIRTRISPPDGSELHQRQISKTMLARTGEPREVAWGAVYLASDESSYVTGIMLPIDGGWTAL
jgi:NAD(P)-dependent dehydrogenase (short-subunit alcohol dehydrogenase family)